MEYAEASRNFEVAVSNSSIIVLVVEAEESLEEVLFHDLYNFGKRLRRQHTTMSNTLVTCSIDTWLWVVRSQVLPEEHHLPVERIAT